MVRLCGASLGLFAFFVATLQGLLAGNPTEIVLWRAIGALAVFCALGLVTGWVAFRVLDEHAIDLHRRMFPGPDDDAQAHLAGPAVETDSAVDVNEFEVADATEVDHEDPLAISADGAGHR